MARPYGESIVFNMLMKVLYIAYLAMYMTYAVTNYIQGTGNDLVNFIVIAFISLSVFIFILANILDWTAKNADARSKIKVRLHTMRNIFKIIKVGVSVLVLAQTITDDSWDALTIAMLVISLPTGLLWLLGEYVYVALAGIFRRGGRRSSTDEDEEYESERRVTPVRDTIDRIKQFADSELITLSPHEVDYDSDEQEDVNDGYLGYEEDDDFSYPPVTPAVTAQDEKREYPEYQGAFCVEEIPLEGEPLQQADTGAEREDWSIEEVIEEVPEEESVPAAEESEDTQAEQEESVQAAQEGALSEQEESAPTAEESASKQEESAPAAEENEDTQAEQEESVQAAQESEDTQIKQEESVQAAQEDAPEEERESTEQEAGESAQEGSGDNE